MVIKLGALHHNPGRNALGS